MISHKQLLEEYGSLPVEAQRQVADLVASLKHHHLATDAARKQLPEIENEPFIGMWRDRDDLADSSEWVRDLRRREWREGNEA